MTEAYTQKETDIGLMPDDWDIVSIGSEFNIQQGKQVSARHRAGDNQKPFLRTANVFWNRIDLTVLDRMNFTAAEELRMRLHLNDVLVCEGGDVGRTALVSKELNGIYYQNHLHRLRVKNESINPLFFAYWMMYCLRFTEYYNGAGNKTTIPNLSQSRLKALLFPKPEKEEQNFIAEIISLIQSAIQKQEQIISTTTELKNALMKKLFTEGMKGESLNETEIGLIPESWEVVELGDVCEIIRKSYQPIKNGNKFYIGLEHILSGSTKIYSHGFEKEIVSNKNQFQAGQIIYGKLRPYLDKAVVPHFDGICSSDILVFDGKNEVSNTFLIHFLHSEKFIAHAKSSTTGVQHPRTSWDSLKKLNFGLPKKNEREEIGYCLDTLIKKIDFHTKKSKSLKSLFQSLLYQLMTGSVRVKDAAFSAKEKILSTEIV